MNVSTRFLRRATSGVSTMFLDFHIGDMPEPQSSHSVFTLPVSSGILPAGPLNRPPFLPSVHAVGSWGTWWSPEEQDRTGSMAAGSCPASLWYRCQDFLRHLRVDPTRKLEPRVTSLPAARAPSASCPRVPFCLLPPSKGCFTFSEVSFSLSKERPRGYQEGSPAGRPHLAQLFSQVLIPKETRPGAALAQRHFGWHRPPSHSRSIWSLALACPHRPVKSVRTRREPGGSHLRSRAPVVVSIPLSR